VERHAAGQGPPLPGLEPSAAPADRAEKITMSRRTLLGSSAAAAAAAYVASLKTTPVGRYLEGVAVRMVDEVPRQPHATKVSSVAFQAERDQDLLLLDFNFYGFKLDTSSKPVALVPTIGAPLIFVQFPPQAIGEAVYPEKTDPPPAGTLDSPPVLSVISGPSFLVFSFPAHSTIPLKTMTFDDILDWSAWTLLVDDVAIVNHKPPLPSFPSGDVTLVECPYGLYLSPVVNPTVVHSGVITTSYVTSFSGTIQPKTSDGVTECWAASLTFTEVSLLPAHGGTPPKESTKRLEPQVSAVWCRELQLYTDFSGTGISTWVNWDSGHLNPVNSKGQPTGKYYATPTSSKIPENE